MASDRHTRDIGSSTGREKRHRNAGSNCSRSLASRCTLLLRLIGTMWPFSGGTSELWKIRHNIMLLVSFSITL